MTGEISILSDDFDIVPWSTQGNLLFPIEIVAHVSRWNTNNINMMMMIYISITYFPIVLIGLDLRSCNDLNIINIIRQAGTGLLLLLIHTQLA